MKTFSFSGPFDCCCSFPTDAANNKKSRWFYCEINDECARFDLCGWPTCRKEAPVYGTAEWPAFPNYRGMNSCDW